MSTQQAIPNVLRTGTQTLNFSNTPAGATNAKVTIDRTVASGLNALAATETFEIVIERSTDGGSTWVQAAGITCQGGVMVTKGVTLAQETLTVGIPGPGTGFRITTTASTPVRIAGTVDYTP